MENPMNKWMIWGETPLFLETPMLRLLLKPPFKRVPLWVPLGMTAIRQDRSHGTGSMI